MITIPFYDYQCNECHHIMQDQLKPFAVKTIECNKCGSTSERMYNFRFVAHGLPNGFITAPNVARREYVAPNQNDKRIDPNIYKTKRPEE